MTTRTLAYGSHPDQVADVGLPEDGPAPLILLLHGGFWRARIDRGYADPLARALAAAGYAVANVEYRRVGDGGGWPETFDDAALALDTLPGRIDRAEPGRIDLARVVWLGHSAGGHLALWAALRDRLPTNASWYRDESARIAGIVALAPVTNLAEAYRRGHGENAVAEFLGGGPDRFPERYAVADLPELGPPPVSTTVVHGAQDQRVPIEMSRDYCAKAGARLVELPGIDHFRLVEPDSPAWPAIAAAVRERVSE
ncbi:alpha/beta hydrolase [Nocardia sp. CDC159]|uniref:Alpha/beta hydrolase n=1 Tax=Nocardia pulmonis TaxID=2951408 RepID=A0A9X2E8B7_9NOCA|nr:MULTISPECIES: alpha/beta hydrolase [Nocardia]MCM6776012.1 alpha/beta hydrolase [Nocardia pulmonis]MCM6788661.1 alpha/beta hydrolase [Nocardia sp. CDC159]